MDGGLSWDVSADNLTDFPRAEEAFNDIIEGLDGGGAALSVYLDGENVLDLSGGFADAAREQPWTSSTPTVVFSCSKGLIAILAHRAVERNLLDLDAPVSQYWPEFAAGGKSDVRVRWLLSHRAGLSAPVANFTVEDAIAGQGIVAALAAQTPLWRPGAAHAYHALTYGWLLGELLERVTSQKLSSLIDTEIAGPLGADLWLGQPTRSTSPIAWLTLGAGGRAAVPVTDGERWIERSLTLGGALPPALIRGREGFNDPRVQAAGIPGAGAIATADALARVWSAVVAPTGGVRLLTDDSVGSASVVESEGRPYFAAPGPWHRWGAGFLLSSDVRPLASARSFGHDGAGGQLAFADPDLKMGFAFVTNVLQGREDDRSNRLVRAILEDLRS